MELLCGNPEFKRFMATPTTELKVLDTKLGKSHVRIKANPVTSTDGNNIGSVLEWRELFSGGGC